MRREEGGVHQHDAVRGSWRKTLAPPWTWRPRPFAVARALAAPAPIAAIAPLAAIAALATLAALAAGGARPLAGQGPSFYTVPPCPLVDPPGPPRPFRPPGIAPPPLP